MNFLQSYKGMCIVYYILAVKNHLITLQPIICKADYSQLDYTAVGELCFPCQLPASEVCSMMRECVHVR